MSTYGKTLVSGGILNVGGSGIIYISDPNLAIEVGDCVDVDAMTTLLTSTPKTSKSKSLESLVNIRGRSGGGNNNDYSGPPHKKYKALLLFFLPLFSLYTPPVHMNNTIEMIYA